MIAYINGKLLGIEKIQTSPYYSQSDEMVKRFNKTFTAMLSAFVNDRKTDWDDRIPYMMMAYKLAVHETTVYSTNMPMLSPETSTPLDIQFEIHPVILHIPEN